MSYIEQLKVATHNSWHYDRVGRHVLLFVSAQPVCLIRAQGAVYGTQVYTVQCTP